MLKLPGAERRLIKQYLWQLSYDVNNDYYTVTISSSVEETPKTEVVSAVDEKAEKEAAKAAQKAARANQIAAAEAAAKAAAASSAE
jgi:hypothetical protein